MNKLLVLLALVVAAILVAAIAWLRPSSAPLDPMVGEARPRDAGSTRGDIELESAGTPSVARASDLHTRQARSMSGPDVEIVSSEGLPIDDAFLSKADDTWQRIRALSGRVSRAELDGAVFVRAPGHRAQVVDHGADRIILEVDALLVVSAPGLRGCLDQGSKGIASVLKLALTSGCSLVFLDDDRLAFAVDTELVARSVSAGEPAFDLAWLSGTRSTVTFAARSGGRFEWPTKCPPGSGLAPLELVLVGELGESAEIDVRVSAATSRDPATPAQIETERRSIGTRISGTSTTSTESFPWGTVATAVPQPVTHTRTVRTFDPVARFEGVLLGSRVDVIAHDDESRSFATGSFFHDGTPARVQMRPAAALIGHVSTSDGSPRPASISVRWTQRMPEGRGLYWKTEVSSAPLDAEGSFRILGPDRIEGRGGHREMPTHAEVEVAAPGFEPCSRSFGFSGGDSRTTWNLQPRPADVLVRTPLEPKAVSLDVGAIVEVPGSEINLWEKRIGAVRRRGEFLEVCFQRWPEHPGEFQLYVDEGGQDGPGAKRPWGEVSHFVSGGDSAQWHAFNRSVDGTFLPEASTAYDITLESAPSSLDASILLWWHNLELSGSGRLLQEGQSLQFEVIAPVSGVRVSWWRYVHGENGEPETRSNSVTLVPGAQTIRVPIDR